MKVLVTGAGGFIGGHLAARLLAEGFDVRAVDIKPIESWFQVHAAAENSVADLRDRSACESSIRDAEHVYHLAADMGGMGFIENNKAACMLSSLITTHLLLASRDHGTSKFFYASSACVYPASRQSTADVLALAESDAYPADPEDGYGWEKLFGERMCRHFSEDFGLATRIARYHNVYGPLGTYEGGREKVPAAMCRKVIIAARSGKYEIEVWGDGFQTRSFTFIDDCIEGTRMLMDSSVDEPLNVGSSDLVSINELLELTAEVAGIDIPRRHDLTAPLGVRGRNSDNTLIRSLLDWEPSTPLHDGLRATYEWILDDMTNRRP